MAKKTSGVTPEVIKYYKNCLARHMGWSKAQQSTEGHFRLNKGAIASFFGGKGAKSKWKSRKTKVSPQAEQKPPTEDWAMEEKSEPPQIHDVGFIEDDIDGGHTG